jgi:hypothetical protein
MKPGELVELVVAAVTHRKIPFKWLLATHAPRAGKKRTR